MMDTFNIRLWLYIALACPIYVAGEMHVQCPSLADVQSVMHTPHPTMQAN